MNLKEKSLREKKDKLREAIEILNNIPRWYPEIGIPLSEPRISDENLGRLKELLTVIQSHYKSRQLSEEEIENRIGCWLMANSKLEVEEICDIQKGIAHAIFKAQEEKDK